MKSLFTDKHLQITLDRLTHQLIENHGDFSNTVLIGLQPRGVFLADRIVDLLKKQLPDTTIQYGKLDITFYRDDFRGETLHIPSEKQEKSLLLIWCLRSSTSSTSYMNMLLL